MNDQTLGTRIPTISYTRYFVILYLTGFPESGGVRLNILQSFWVNQRAIRRDGKTSLWRFIRRKRAVFLYIFLIQSVRCVRPCTDTCLQVDNETCVNRALSCRGKMSRSGTVAVTRVDWMVSYYCPETENNGWIVTFDKTQFWMPSNVSHFMFLSFLLNVYEFMASAGLFNNSDI